MKIDVPFSRASVLSLTAVSVLSLFALTSCNDKEEEKAPETPAAAPEAPQVDTLAQAREALFNEALYELAQKATDPAVFPELNEEVKVLLEYMEAYYTELAKGSEGTMERARLSLQIADTLRNLNSFQKGVDAYNRAMGEFNALPEDIRNSADGQRCLSDIESGLGACLLAQGKATEALPHYEAAFKTAEAQFEALAPAEDAQPKQGEVDPALSRCATDYLDCIRCLGDCQRAVDDPEEARTTYAKGQEAATRLKVLSSTMSISYVKLLTALGNLDNSAGRSKEALTEWITAANICKQLNNSSPRLDVKSQTKRCFDALLPAIQAVAAGMQPAEQQPAAENNAQTEPISPELKAAAAEAAAAAPEQAPAAAPAAAPAKPAPKPAAKPAPRKRK